MAQTRVRLVKKPAPPSARVHALLQGAKEHMMQGAKMHVEMEERLMTTWSKESRAEFIPRSEMDATQVRVMVELRGDPAPFAHITVWELISHGTSEKWIGWSADFEAKTTPGSITSGPGAGRVWASKTPKPGIDARNFAENINKRIPTDEFVRIGIEEGLKRSAKL